ncbi:hypothetical protein [Nostoc sp. C052]|nr:hypothetical protein [Nostoc sp. C052]
MGNSSIAQNHLCPFTNANQLTHLLKMSIGLLLYKKWALLNEGMN